jgi:two-component system OmpR family response regulator
MTSQPEKTAATNSFPASEFVANVLIVEDDSDIRTLLADYLGSHACRVLQATDGASMWKALDRHPVDIVILDLNLPGSDGLTLCRELRARSNLPVIMLTARSTPLDRVMGLETGADDYVCKPFEPLELLSRVRSVLRRTRATLESNTSEPVRIHFAGWILDITLRHLVNPEGIVVSLSGAEFRLLRIFLDNPNRVLNRDHLMSLLQGRDATAFDRSIDLQVSRLRQKIEVDSKLPVIIKTVRNEGYVLASTVKVERP